MVTVLLLGRSTVENSFFGTIRMLNWYKTTSPIRSIQPLKTENSYPKTGIVNLLWQCLLQTCGPLEPHNQPPLAIIINGIRIRTYKLSPACSVGPLSCSLDSCLVISMIVGYSPVLLTFVSHLLIFTFDFQSWYTTINHNYWR